MKLNFLINDNYLIIHTLKSNFSSKKYKREVIGFKNFAWKKSQKIYNLFTDISRLLPDDIDDILDIKKLDKEILSFFKTLKNSTQYRKILLRTQNYLDFCKKQWIKNYPVSLKIVRDLTGFNFNKTFTIYITHPSLKNGYYFGKNKIGWGHNEDWPNYTTVYLWHEILHSYFQNKDFNHAIIQFITDNELRIILNGGKYPPFVGHNDLFPLMRKMLPYWKQYLKEKPRDIKKFAVKEQNL
jgi:transposase